MTRRFRMLLGTVVILAFVMIYALVAMALAESRIVDAPKLIQTVFYFLLGVSWILPIIPLIAWMERPDRLRGVDAPSAVPGEKRNA